MVVMVNKHCYHKHTDSLLQRTHVSETSKMNKLFTQSQEGLWLNFPVYKYNTTSHHLKQIRCSMANKSYYMKITDFQASIL